MLAVREPRRLVIRPASLLTERAGTGREAPRLRRRSFAEAWVGWGKAGATYHRKFLFWCSRGGRARRCGAEAVVMDSASRDGENEAREPGDAAGWLAGEFACDSQWFWAGESGNLARACGWLSVV